MLVNTNSTNSYPFSTAQKRPDTAQKSGSLIYQDVSTRISALTDQAQVSMSSRITDLTASENQTSFAYYKDDNSMAMRVESQTDVHLHEETYNFDVTFSAEALGLKAKDFANNKPMVLKFSFQQKEINYSSQISMQTVNRVRDPQDVLMDLAKALQNVMRDNGNKSVSYVLDDEARKSLLSDPKITKLVNELILLMATINLAKKAGNANNYTIYVSGKAKPMLDIKQKTDVDGKTQTVNFNITINPPGQQIKPAAAPAPEAAVAQPANLNVAI